MDGNHLAKRCMKKGTHGSQACPRDVTEHLVMHCQNAFYKEIVKLTQMYSLIVL